MMSSLILMSVRQRGTEISKRVDSSRVSEFLLDFSAEFLAGFVKLSLFFS